MYMYKTVHMSQTEFAQIGFGAKYIFEGYCLYCSYSSNQKLSQ